MKFIEDTLFFGGKVLLLKPGAQRCLVENYKMEANSRIHLTLIYFRYGDDDNDDDGNGDDDPKCSEVSWTVWSRAG